jgi:hypothetical protein
MIGAAAADWQLIGPEGTATLDALATLPTDDGAVIFMQLNRIQPVGKGTVQEDLSLDYEWYEIR